MAKEKISFDLDGIFYSDIDASQWGGKDRWYVGVAGTAKMIRQYLKAKYPNLPTKDYFWIRSDSFSGGDSIRVYFNNAPTEFFTKLKSELDFKFQEGKFDGMTDSYNYTKQDETSKDGKIISYGTKYLTVDNRKPWDAQVSEVDWSRAIEEGKPKSGYTPKQSSPRGTTYSMGDVLKDCSGWVISKKTLPDGRIVYNAKIKPDTPKNKTDWDTIKGDVYIESGFKWGRFGAFEKWGSIENESAVIDALCKVLGKYYDAGEDQTPPKEEPAPQPNQNLPEVGDKFYVKTEIGGNKYTISKIDMGTVYVQLPEQYGGSLVDYPFGDVVELFKNGTWVKVGDNFPKPTPPKEEPAPAPTPQSSAPKSKEDIQKAIKGLQYLADKGNEKAIKAIKGLQILLNK